MYLAPVIDSYIDLADDGPQTVNNPDSSFARLQQEMEKASVKTSILHALPSAGQNGFLAEICERNEGRFFALACFRPGEEDIERFLKITANTVFKGVKLYPAAGSCSPLDEKFAPLYRAASEKDWVVYFDGPAETGVLPIDEIRPGAYDRLAKMYPEMKIVISRCGVPWVMEALFVAKANRNVYLDCAFILDEFAGSSIQSDILYLAGELDDKLIYGSGFPEKSVNRYLSLARMSLNRLPKEKRINILGKNAASLFGISLEWP